MTPRQSRTPRERAEIVRDRAKRRHERAMTLASKVGVKAKAAAAEVVEARAALDYAAANPALKADADTPAGTP